MDIGDQEYLQWFVCFHSRGVDQERGDIGRGDAGDALRFAKRVRPVRCQLLLRLGSQRRGSFRRCHGSSRSPRPATFPLLVRSRVDKRRHTSAPPRIENADLRGIVREADSTISG